MRKISRKDCTTIAMVNGNEKKFDKIIIDGTVKEWVGFGWIDLGEPTAEDRRTLPEVRS